ncbi:ankyrin repeat domain-containing protein [bacterium]|nr:ankyrin repeat domain-containing protein [bacterium]
MKEGYFELVDNLLRRKKVSVATTDESGNNVLMKLAKLHKYELVNKYLSKDKDIINHQNNDGDTLLHILATRNYMKVAGIIKKLKRNDELAFNLKNNEGKTILDIAIEKDNLTTAFKILEDKRFNNIDVMSFLSFYKTFIKNREYGKYTKLSNLEIMVSNLEKKNELLPMIDKLVNMISDNFDHIKKELMRNKLTSMDNIIHEVLVEVKV